MRTITFIILLLTFLGRPAALAQDYSFTHYLLDKLSLSPAFAAVGDYSELGCAVRSQWPSASGGCRIYMAEYQQKLPSASSGLAARLYGNLEGGGAYRQTGAAAVYACEVPLSGSLKCSMGIEAGYTWRSLSQGGLVYYSMLPGATGAPAAVGESVPSRKCAAMYLSAGAALYTRLTLAGIGIHRLARKEFGPGCLAGLCITLMADHKIVVEDGPDRERRFVAPCITFAHTPISSTLTPGVYYQGSKITLSASARACFCGGKSATSISAYAGYALGRLEIGVGHDFAVSGALSGTGGATEACVKYKIKKY